MDLSYQYCCISGKRNGLFQQTMKEIFKFISAQKDVLDHFVIRPIGGSYRLECVQKTRKTALAFNEYIILRKTASESPFGFCCEEMERIQ